MTREKQSPAPAGLQSEDFWLAEENHNAILTMWTGIGAVFSLLLTCALGVFRPTQGRTHAMLALLGVLLLISVILYFAAGKRDERWYVVCALLNYAGIGFALLLLLDTLGLTLSLIQLALSGLPAAAVLFGVVMFYLGADPDTRDGLLKGGIVILVLMVLAAGIIYMEVESGFAVCMGVCALMSCGGLGALLWANNDSEYCSVYRGLAVASFSVYLLVLAAAIIALIVVAMGAGSKSENKKSKSRGSGSSGGSILGRLFDRSTTRSNYRVHRTYRTHYPSYLWYYTPYTRYSAINRMEDLSDEEKERARARYRILRRVALFCVVVIVVLAIVASVKLGCQ